jgi:hypothetical protein
MTPSDFSAYWERALDDPDRIWPEDVLTDDEWNQGWFDRQVIAGLKTEAERVTVAPWFGGTKPTCCVVTPVGCQTLKELGDPEDGDSGIRCCDNCTH